MSDLIDRQAVLNLIGSYGGIDLKARQDMLKIIQKMPSVTPTERTGHWIMDRQRETRQCDKCMTVYRWSFNPHNYCPNCGCRMVEPQESDHKCRTCKHYTSGERDGSCGSYICKHYSGWESEDKE